jgi:hypothetical protein
VGIHDKAGPLKGPFCAGTGSCKNSFRVFDHILEDPAHHLCLKTILLGGNDYLHRGSLFPLDVETTLHILNTQKYRHPDEKIHAQNYAFSNNY